MRIADIDRRQKNDRRMLRAITPTDQLGRLKAIHTRHLDIEQNHGDIMAQ
jgi:hypothetical protein